MKTLTLFITKQSTLIFTMFIAFFAPIKGMVFLVGLSTILDTCFGIWRAYQMDEIITSRKARFGLVPKIVAYCSAVCLIYATDVYMINDLTKMAVSVDFISTKLIALLLISIEVKSMDESFQAVKGYSFIEKIKVLILKAKDIKKEL